MSVSLQSITVRSSRRIRLKFNGALGAGAYSANWFSITCLDGSSADPGVTQAYLIASANTDIELALGLDLAAGGSYRIACAAGIPGADASTSAAENYDFYGLNPKPSPSLAVSSGDVSAILYGQDLAHDGNDLVETPDGDLALLSGVENAMTGVTRLALGNGLPYNKDYGPHLRQFVDAPGPTLRSARARVERSLRTDDRVRKATSELQADDNSGDITLNLDVAFVGGKKRTTSKSVT